MKKEKLDTFLRGTFSDEFNREEFYSEYTEYLLAKLKEKNIKNKVNEEEKEGERE